VIAHAIAAVSFVAGCGVSARSIGAVCPGPDGGTPIDASCGGDGGPEASPTGTTLAVGLDRSGTSLLDERLAVGGATVPAALRLRGEQANDTQWPSQTGGALARGAGAVGLDQVAPFTDGTRAVRLGTGVGYAAAEPSVGAVGADDFALEVILRATPAGSVADKLRTGGPGWTLASRETGQLVLTVLDASSAVDIVSEPLPTGAWIHCLYWVSRSAGGRADCDGRAGTLATVPANLGTLDGPTPLSVGGGAGVAHVAFLALYRTAPGGLGAAAAWQSASARRFAALTGALPSVARGSALPLPGLRDGVAYLDLDRQPASGPERRVFLVGPDWPRVACRTDVAGAHACGFLSEPRRTRGVPASPSGWTSRELVTFPAGALLPEDGPPFYALAPSPVVGPHVLSVVRDEIVAAQVFSFFTRTESFLSHVGVVAGTRGMAVFDVGMGRVVSAPAGVRATIERWGEGLYRCSIAFDGGQKAAELGIHLLDGGGNELAAGDGTTPALWVAGLQLDVGLVYAGSLLAADTQLGDRLTFVGDDGNLPAGITGEMDVRVLLPAGPRLTDQAIINLNRGGTFDDQVQLSVVGNDKGFTKFWALRGGDTYWTVDHPTPVVDGLLHTLRAGWDSTTARVDLDGVVRSQALLLPNDAPFPLNRVDVGFSGQSSGALEGLVGALRIGAPQ
jgi:hypothetical protein